MFNFFKKKGKTLDQHINETKDLNVRGVFFKIRKIGVVDHLTGSKVLTENFHLYKNPSQQTAALAIEKLKEHYRHIFVNCVVEPELVLKAEDAGPGKTFVDNIFADMELAHELYMEIMIFTHGKKKVKTVLSRYR